MQNSLSALGDGAATAFLRGQQNDRQERNFEADQGERVIKQIRDGVRAADTPEKWQALTSRLTASFGEESVAPFADFGTRDQLLTEVDQSLPERQLSALQAQRATTNRNALSSLAQRQDNADRNFGLAEDKFEFEKTNSLAKLAQGPKPITNVGRINRAVATGEITAQEGDALRLNATAPKKGITVSPDGTVTIGGSGKAPTEGQSKANIYSTRMEKAEKILTELENQGLSEKNTAISKVPVVGNFFLDSKFRQFEQAKRDFINATLRQESGAVISDNEFANGEKQYFPVLGDDPKTITQKRANRITAAETTRQASGPFATKDRTKKKGNRLVFDPVTGDFK